MQLQDLIKALRICGTPGGNCDDCPILSEKQPVDATKINCFDRLRILAADKLEEMAKAASEVKHGKWIKNNLGIAVEYTCSVCGHTYCEGYPKQAPEKFCCKCGAKNE